MVSLGHYVLADVLDQFLLYGKWGGAFVRNKANAVADTEDVRVDGHGCLVEDDALDYVRRLASHAWQSHQQLQLAGHLAIELVLQHASHADQMLGFVVGVADAFDVLVNHLGRCQSHCLGCWVVLKEPWRDQIYSFVRALGTQNDGYQQLEWRGVVQFGLSHRHGLAEIGHHALVSLFLCHAKYLYIIVRRLQSYAISLNCANSPVVFSSSKA